MALRVISPGRSEEAISVWPTASGNQSYIWICIASSMFQEWGNLLTLYGFAKSRSGKNFLLPRRNSLLWLIIENETWVQHPNCDKGQLSFSILSSTLNIVYAGCCYPNPTERAEGYWDYSFWTTDLPWTCHHYWRHPRLINQRQAWLPCPVSISPSEAHCGEWRSFGQPMGWFNRWMYNCRPSFQSFRQNPWWSQWQYSTCRRLGQYSNGFQRKSTIYNAGFCHLS